MKTVIKNTKGVTLTEVMVSVGLIVVVILALLGAMKQGAISSKVADMVYTEYYLAQRRIDLLKKFDFAQIDPASEETDVRVAGDGTADDNGEYSITTAIDSNYTGSAHLKKIKVSVDRVKINADGATVIDADSGRAVLVGLPVVMETVLTDLT